MTDSDQIQRRRLLRNSGAALSGASVLGLAGCTGDGGNGNNGGNADTETTDKDSNDSDRSGNDEAAPESLEFRMAGGYIEDVQHWESVSPWSLFKVDEKVREFSDGRITPQVIGSGEFCGETTCAEKVVNGLVQIAADSASNSSPEFPENNAWLLPQVFPNSNSIYHTITKPASWELYWVPFARKYGVIPFTVSYASMRTVLLGKAVTDRIEQADEITPDILDGFDLRRSADATSSTIIDQWEANPVAIQFAEFLQAMKEGAVAGVVTAPGPIIAFGGGEVVTDAVVNDGYHQLPIEWANVEWLKGLSEANRSVLAKASRWVLEGQGQMIEEVNKVRNGQANPVPEGSAFDEFNINVHILSESERATWQDPINAKQNPELYSDIINNANSLFKGDDILDYLYESGHENAVHNDPGDYTVDAWWDDYITEV